MSQRFPGVFNNSTSNHASVCCSILLKGFAAAGFPGPDEEFDLAQRVLRPAAEGGLLVDASCGSGLFTRRFVQSGCYSNVVALDYSDSMLNQTVTFFDEKSVPKDNLTLVRADIGRIPFPDDSVDGVHSGAAIHCWPNPKVPLCDSLCVDLNYSASDLRYSVCYDVRCASIIGTDH